MSSRDEYTSEIYKSQYSNSFELANKAIIFARYSLKSGHYMSLDDILDEMKKDPKTIQSEIEILESKYRPHANKDDEKSQD